jgi:DNA-directed RNA polymerase specialized sigma24 family protein
MSVIIQQVRNEAAAASDDQLMAAVVNHQAVFENPLTFETSLISNRIEVHDLSELLTRVLQEVPEVQKEVIRFASKGMSRREIAAKSKISLGTGKRGIIWLSETPGGY